MVFCHTGIGICVHVSAVYHSKSSTIDSLAQAICINFTSQLLFVNIDLMQIFLRLAQVNVYPFLQHTDEARLSETDARVMPVVILKN